MLDHREPSEPHPPVDRFEFWVRFVCGAGLGVMIWLAVFLPSSTAAWNGWPALAGCGVVCGLLAGWFGDRFWQAVLSWWGGW